MIEARPESQNIACEENALKALQFYNKNYDQILFLAIDRNEKKVLGKLPYRCRYCQGSKPERTFKKRAHAVSELLGNKALTSLYECDQCNKRFCSFEDDLGKMTLPLRSISGVQAKRGTPILPLAGELPSVPSTMSFTDNNLKLHVGRNDGSHLVDEEKQTLTVFFVNKSYRPLAAYKALCKSAYALLPEDELPHFEELRLWLCEDDLQTGMVYSDGAHYCYQTVVFTPKPFPKPIVALLRRKEQIDAPYMTFFIATGNFSYEIFLPCPAKDNHMSGKQVSFHIYPHLYQLQPWLAQGKISEVQLDLSATERTIPEKQSFTWSFEERVKES